MPEPQQSNFSGYREACLVSRKVQVLLVFDDLPNAFQAHRKDIGR